LLFIITPLAPLQIRFVIIIIKRQAHL
jgi:hypothetical protein